MTVAFERSAWSVADVIADSGAEFLHRHGGHLTGSQRQALSDLARCRTAALGGHVHLCRDCGRDRAADCRMSVEPSADGFLRDVHFFRDEGDPSGHASTAGSRRWRSACCVALELQLLAQLREDEEGFTGRRSMPRQPLNG